jgi:peptidase A4-like protein
VTVTGLSLVSVGLFLTASGAASVPTAAPTSFAPHAGSLALSNWAGYIAGGSSTQFTTASADWTVPTVTCLANRDLFAPWIGIDGYGDSTVEQTGVATSCASGAPESEAWYEMFPKRPVYLKEPVSTGDAIAGSVSYSLAIAKFTITISDVTQGWTFTVSKKLKKAQRASAEAVIESPVSAYPRIPGVTFTNVLFNGEALSTFNPVVSKSGNPVTYAPGTITGGTSFTIAST